MIDAQKCVNHFLFAINYSVSFTLDTYAHVLDDHKQVGMALMGEMFEMDSSVELVSLQYPDVNYIDDNMAEGLQFIKEGQHEKSLTEGNCTFGQTVVPHVIEQNQMLLSLSL